MQSPSNSYPLLPCTPRARRLYSVASAVAKARGDRHVGIDHLLIAIIRIDKGVAAYVLRNSGVTEPRVTSLLSAPI